MNRIDKVFAQLRARAETAFIPYITAGDPDLAVTVELLRCLADNGADCIELGVPFSDPMADGPTIQEASQRALQRPFALAPVLDCVRAFRADFDVPVILFGYYNPFLQFGLEALASQAADAGVDGLLVVDLPPEEADDLIRAAQAHGLATIFLAAPTSTAERLRLIAAAASGFVYLVSVTGVTGARDLLSSELRDQVASIRQYTDLPVGVGFGISQPAHVREISSFADAVIVGSALVKIIQRHAGTPDLLREVGAFVSRMKQETRS